MNRNVVAIVQARMGSVRFPGKVLQPVLRFSLIELLLRRLSGSRTLGKIVLATSTDPRNDRLVAEVQALGFDVFRGSETDVLNRYYQAARSHGSDVVVRITGDCPLIDPMVVDLVVETYLSGAWDYVSNVAPPTFPDGLDCEVFSFAALERAEAEATDPSHREHVTSYFRESGRFSMFNVASTSDHSTERWTVDEPGDLEVVRGVFAEFSPRIDFTWKQVVDLRGKKPEMFARNDAFVRNEGKLLGTGQKLWKRAREVIPGGNMLLSKRPEMFLPDQWPAYFSRAKGCRVWDLDGRELIDMSIMGIGTNTLGYGHPDVDAAVRETINQGNMSTLNCPEEVYLAERLIALHPWADMVRFSRSGGEANAIAIRIARAAAGKDKVAICGYHGWHDWYLSANLSDDRGLDGHLLPGLEPNGVPRNLRGTVFPFSYNNISELEELVAREDIGVIKMEVSRNFGPAEGFLEGVRKLATVKGIVLIFDECTSGFRETFGGLHKKFGVEPDMAMFGKAMGNGYAITAIIGRRSIMEAAQTTFISSTFWTERIGPSAALKTLEVMEKDESWAAITSTGNEIRRGWQELAEKHSLEIEHFGIPALAGFTFQCPSALAYKTLISQEMLSAGYLAGNCVYSSTAHTPGIVADYFSALDPVFGLIRECEDGRDVKSLLHGPVCHAGFKRLN